MHDMDAFERQLARDIDQEMGPIYPVDAAAIFASIGTRRYAGRTFRSLFSATKYVVAAGVVVLFGGFVLMSASTNPSSDGVPAAGGSASPSASVSHAPDRQDKIGPDPVTSPKEENVKITRTPLATALAIGLLVSPAAPAVAQVDLMAPAAVTGEVTNIQEETAGSRAYVDGAVRGEGVVATQTWEASDPRLSGEFSTTYNYDFYEGLELFVAAGTVVLENGDGGWEGTFEFLGGDAFQGTSTVSMHGLDAYEGLTSYIVVDWDAGPRVFKAAIFQGDMPETASRDK